MNSPAYSRSIDGGKDVVYSNLGVKCDTHGGTKPGREIGPCEYLEPVVRTLPQASRNSVQGPAPRRARPGARCRGRVAAGAERVATRGGELFRDPRDPGVGRHARRRTLCLRRAPCPLGACLWQGQKRKSERSCHPEGDDEPAGEGHEPSNVSLLGAAGGSLRRRRGGVRREAEGDHAGEAGEGWFRTG